MKRLRRQNQIDELLADYIAAAIAEGALSGRVEIGERTHCANRAPCGVALDDATVHLDPQPSERAIPEPDFQILDAVLSGHHALQNPANFLQTKGKVGFVDQLSQLFRTGHAGEGDIAEVLRNFANKIQNVFGDQPLESELAPLCSASISRSLSVFRLCAALSRTFIYAFT